METFQENLDQFFNEAVDINLTNLRQCGFWIKTMNHQVLAAEVRQQRQEKGLPSPPIMICSITKRKNLVCKCCYTRSEKIRNGMEITPQRFEHLSREASGIGTNIIMIAGGEPLMRRDILEAAGRVKETVFPVITNGTLLNSDYIRFFKKNRNLIPVLGIEGDSERMDERRGRGLYEKVISVAEVLRRSKMLFGLSLILTRDNFDRLTNPEVLQHYHKLGSRMFFLVEYLPATDEDAIHRISADQKNRLPELLKKVRQQLPGLYVCLPGQEEQYGGCLALGRGLSHIDPTGDVEPCVFAVLENREWVEEQLNTPESLSA